MDGARHDFHRLCCASAAGLALCFAAADMAAAQAEVPVTPEPAAAGPEPATAGPVPDTTADPVPDTTAGPVPDAAATDPGKPAEYQCDQPGSDGQEMLDLVQRGVYLSVCGTARWFDGLFGTRRYDQDSDATFGRLGVTEFWDDRDDFRTRVRLRARIALPTAQKRLKLLFGRVDDQEIEQDSQSEAGTNLPSSFGKVADESWLLGLGYSKQGKLHNGFDFSTGVRLRTPVDPYSKATYRHNFVFSDDVTLRARQTLFWRDSRGWGETTEVSVDKLLTERLLLRWDNGATLAEDVRRLEWYSSLVTFQSLGNRRALAYTGFVRGVMNTDIPVRDYGVEVRYRVRVLRKWLFLEARSSLTWPRETLAEEREINPGVGLGFEMYFGPVPESDLR